MQDRQFIKMGPQIVDKYTQRTASNILLYVEHDKGDQDDNRMAVLNCGVDMYRYAINFGALPNLNEKDIADLKLMERTEQSIFDERL